MRVEELSGAQLDYWVALTAGYRVYDDGQSNGVMWVSDAKDSLGYLGPYRGGLCWRPSESWEHGGPIIERENIATYRQKYSDGTLREWCACASPDIEDGPVWNGETPLVAAMRYFVASKYGESVPDEYK